MRTATKLIALVALSATLIIESSCSSQHSKPHISKSSMPDSTGSNLSEAHTKGRFIKKRITCSLDNIYNYGYRLLYITDTSRGVQCQYQLDSIRLLSINQKIELIKELLSYQGDTSLCALPVMGYNPNVSTIIDPERPRYSIQVEALFWVNQIYYSEQFSYASIPILVNNQTSQHESIDGPGIALAFQEYKNWIQEVKRVGWKKAHKLKLEPLDKRVKWLA